MQDTPNDGLIRYFGFLNQERLLMTDLETMKQVLQRDALKFDKLPGLANLQAAAGVSGLVTSKGEIHKVHRRVTAPAFNSLSTRGLYPTIWQSALKVSDSLAELTRTVKPIELHPFLQLACLETGVKAGFSLEVNALQDPKQPLVKNYQRPFRLGQRSPLYLKLLQICPEPIQPQMVSMISKIMGVNISGMKMLLANSLSDIDSQPYLLGVVNEILRLYPNTTHRGRVANSNTSVNNLFLPTGTVLTWPVYAINRDPRYWGSDANAFKPERWFTKESVVKPHSRDAFSFMTFGQGPRKCPGEAYTRAVLANMLVALIGRFEFRRPIGYADVMEDDDAIRVKFGIVMKAEIWVDVKEVPGWSSVPTKQPTQ
ncbi:hypothetical protein N0V94_006035 [Neodidymelliopsis sp. IMI 364377]|nr:hypothetical protein N0V94_006035 [Neodidymelliopsis sp. IMI 364377]